jgi:mono/diheme cytochrome c family protein
MRKILLVLAVLFTASVASASNQEGKELFENRCSKCHLLERALNKTKSLEAWERTITRMAKYSGGVIKDSEVMIIAAYLAGIGVPEVVDKKKEEVADVQ